MFYVKAGSTDGLYNATMDGITADTKAKAAKMVIAGSSTPGGNTDPSATPATATAQFTSGNWDTDPTTTISKGSWSDLVITSVTWADDKTKTGTFSSSDDYTYNTTSGEFKILGNTAATGKGLKTSTIDSTATKLTVTINAASDNNADSDTKTKVLTFEISLS